MKPILYLDVDGVLNVYNESEAPTRTEGGGPVWIPAGTTERVAKLREHFELVWSTAWQGVANQAWLPLLGYPDESWEYISYSDLKLTEMLRHAKGRRWAFVDDDADWELRELGWTRERHCAGNLIINADPEVGLTDDHVKELIDFATDTE